MSYQINGYWVRLARNNLGSGYEILALRLVEQNINSIPDLFLKNKPISEGTSLGNK